MFVNDHRIQNQAWITTLTLHPETTIRTLYMQSQNNRNKKVGEMEETK
jgi:hypothetical protein